MSCTPTLMPVPPETGAKSTETGAEVVLIVPLAGDAARPAVCGKSMRVRNRVDLESCLNVVVRFGIVTSTGGSPPGIGAAKILSRGQVVKAVRGRFRTTEHDRARRSFASGRGVRRSVHFFNNCGPLYRRHVKV
jgi:hypothetical protein